MTAASMHDVGGRVDARKRRKTFNPVNLEIGDNDSDFPGLKFRVHLRDCEDVLIDLSEEQPQSLAAQFAYVLWCEAKPLGQLSTSGPLSNALASVRNFIKFLNDADVKPRITLLKDINSNIFGEYEQWLRATPGRSEGWPYGRMGAFRRILLLAEHYSLVSASCLERLNYIADGPSGISTSQPRDAYSSKVAAEIKRGAFSDYIEIIHRVTVAGPSLASCGRDPFHDQKWTDENLAWAIQNKNVGILSALNIEYSVRDIAKSGNLSHNYILSLFHLNSDDIFSLTSLISLITGMPIESVKELAADCLCNESRGYVDIRYIKRRSGISTEKIKRVRCDSEQSAGAIIRKIVDLTSFSRSLAEEKDRRYLFVGCYGRRSKHGREFRRIVPQAGGGGRFCARHEINGDDNKRLCSIAPARLRKTYKMETYKSLNGHLVDVADDHTVGVFARHYAKIPAMAEVHEQTIVDGLRDAFDAAMAPCILGKQAEAELLDAPSDLARRGGSGSEDVDGISSSRSDAWLASCIDPSTSPYGVDDENDCVSPVIGCLGCKNAVISFSKLPAILSFLNHMLMRRDQMDSRAWAIRYGIAYTRIAGSILPRFEEKEIQEAKELLENDTKLLWLPAELALS